MSKEQEQICDVKLSLRSKLSEEQAQHLAISWECGAGCKQLQGPLPVG